MTTRISRRALLAGAAAFTLAMPHVARAAVRTVKLGTNTSPAAQYGQGCQVFAEAVAAHPELASSLKIDIRFNAELGDELTMMTNLRQSTLDMSICPTLVVGSFCPEAGLLDAPFIFKDVVTARAALDGALGAEYAESMKAKDINVLAWCENGLRHITSNRPVRTPKDLEGLKLRVPQSEITLASFKALGADAKPLAFTQLYEALRTGQFDAQENPIGTMETIKLNEVQKYLSLTGHTYSAAFFSASPDVMEDLSPAQIEALKSCAKLGAARTRQVAEAAQQDGVGRLQKAGMTVVDGVDVAAFVAACKPATQALGKTYGADRVQRLLAAGA